MPPKSSE